MIKIIVQGAPVPWKPPRATVRNGRIFVYTDTKMRQYQKEIANKLKNVFPLPIDWPVSLTVVAVLPAPKRKTSRYPTTRPDTTNILKCIEDALVKGGVLKDDKYVIIARATKKYVTKNQSPHVVITIKDLGG